MKRLKSKSGLTLVELVASMAILIIIVVGFATLYTFAVTTVFFAGHDSESNAAARSEADAFFAIEPDALPVIPDSTATIFLRGNRVDASFRIEVGVVHENITVTTARGDDGEINAYRRRMP